MALRIRLSRGGAKKRPFYRIVVADARRPRDGHFIERLGTYNPLLSRDDDARVMLKEDRIKHWLSVGAKPTDRVHRFLDAAGLLQRAARSNPKKGLPGKKAQERLEAQKAAEEEAAQAAAEPAEAETEQAEVAETEATETETTEDPDAEATEDQTADAEATEAEEEVPAEDESEDAKT